MDNLKVIKAMEQDAIDIMKERKILASFTISAALYYLNLVSERDAITLLNANNVMMRTAGERYNADTVFLEDIRGKRFKCYDDIKECLEDWLLTFRSSLIKEVWDLNIIIRKLSNKEYSKVNLQPYIDAYKLGDIDDKVLSELYPSNQTIIEVPVNQNMVAAICQQLSGYTPKTDPRVEVKKAPVVKKKAVPVTYTKGSKFIVEYANIFCDPGSGTAIRSFKGNVWLYDGIQRNGRYAIVTNKDNLKRDRSFIDGYIKTSDLK